MVPLSSRKLLDLPDELLIDIFSFLDTQTLYNATTVCRHFDGLAEPFLYRAIYVRNGRQAAALSIGLRTNSRRAIWVKDLLVSTKFGEDQGLELLPPHIRRMRNLENLRLETPDCNSMLPEERVPWINLQDRYERIFESASAVSPKSSERLLPNLKTCTLHFVDSRLEIYAISRYAMIFLHPNLRALTVSCASTDWPHNLLAPFQHDRSLCKSTALEHLHMEECDIFSPSLEILLSYPRSLKSLKISEGVRYDRLFSQHSARIHGNAEPGEFVNSIAKHCSDSLEHLSLSLGYSRGVTETIYQPGKYLNLTAFTNMKRLDVDNRTLNLLRVHHHCDHATYRRFPPSLEMLKVFGISIPGSYPRDIREFSSLPVNVCLIENKEAHGLGKLRDLVFSYEYHNDDDDTLRFGMALEGLRPDVINQVEEVQDRIVLACKRVEQKCKKSGVRLEIEMVALPHGFIPPYLWPEDKPRSYVFWESEAKLPQLRKEFW